MGTAVEQPTEIIATWDRYIKARSRADFNTLLLHYYPWLGRVSQVASPVMRWRREDLISEAVPTLMYLIYRYRPDKGGLTFTNYAFRPILFQMLKSIGAQRGETSGSRRQAKRYINARALADAWAGRPLSEDEWEILRRERGIEPMPARVESIESYSNEGCEDPYEQFADGRQGTPLELLVGREEGNGYTPEMPFTSWADSFRGIIGEAMNDAAERLGKTSVHNIFAKVKPKLLGRGTIRIQVAGVRGPLVEMKTTADARLFLLAYLARSVRELADGLHVRYVRVSALAILSRRGTAAAMPVVAAADDRDYPAAEDHG